MNRNVFQAYDFAAGVPTDIPFTPQPADIFDKSAVEDRQ